MDEKQTFINIILLLLFFSLNVFFILGFSQVEPADAGQDELYKEF